MGRAFAIIIIVIAVVSAYFFVAHAWMPLGASEHAPALDHHLHTTLLEAGVLFLLSQAMLAVFVWKYRDKSDGSAMQIFPGGAKGPVITAFLLVGLEVVGLQVMGSKVWAKLYREATPADAVRVYVSAEQFAYYFRYPGRDGNFGAMHPEKIDTSSGNFFGLDKEHEEESRDDIVTATLAIPVDRTVELILHAKDVNHSLYVPAMRIQQDFVPGIDIPIHFRPTKVGDYQIVCTQLCGMGHHGMKATLRVLSAADYERWLQERADF
jgi:cytochrome c oxidase subunit 2